MNYLVTGSAGFIASSVCEQLINNGHNVVGLDNMNDAYYKRIKEWRLRRLQIHPKFHFHLMDICD